MRLSKKIILGLLTIGLISFLVGYSYMKHQMKKRLGAFTEVINPDSYFQKYTSIGIKNVNILDIESGKFIPNRNVVLKNGIIQKIDSIDILDSSIEYIEGIDKYLIPGLVDTHVHLQLSKNDLYLYLANGVTTVWEMMGNHQHLEWKREKQKGSISPEIYVASSKLGSQKGVIEWFKKYFYWHINVTNEKSSRKKIKALKNQGYDAIKLGSHLNQKIYDIILDEGKKQNIPILGHLPKEIGLDRMYKSGLSQLAHVEEITKSMAHEFGELDYDNTSEYVAYIKSKSDSVALKLKQNNIAVSTTVWLMESLPKQKFSCEEFIQTIEFKYANPPIVEGEIFSKLVMKGWLPGNNRYENLQIKNDPEIRPKSEKYTEAYVEGIQIMTKILNENDVVILAGTDANANGVVPGFSLHDELLSLVNIGLTNSEALRSTTIAPAKWTNKTTTGAVKVGYKADLVLLLENPLENIKNTNSIEKVFFDSFYLNEVERKNLLEAVEKVNEKARTIDISKWN